MTIEEGAWYRFGAKSLRAKMIRAWIGILLFILAWVVLVIALQSGIFNDFVTNIPVRVYKGLIIAGGLLALLMLVWSTISAWIDYRYREFMISDSGLYMRSGFFTRVESSSPYRFITNVSYSRGIIDQILGVSTYTIELMSDERDKPQADDIVLADMDPTIGAALQDMLLDRANPQRMTVSPTRTSPAQSPWIG